MQQHSTNQNLDTPKVPCRLEAAPAFPRLNNQRPQRRKIRIPVWMPRRPECLTRRALLAALREAELAEWMASGGDFLSSNYQPTN